MAKDALGFDIVEELSEEERGTQRRLTSPTKSATVDELGFEVIEQSAPPSTVPTDKPSASPTQTKLTILPKEEQASGAQLTDEGQIKNRGFIRPEEVSTIAQRYQVDEAQLRGLVPYYNISVAGDEDYADRVSGFVGEAILNGLPMWIYKKTRDNPNMRLALDDLRELADRQKTKTQLAGEIAGGLLTGIGTVGGAAKAAKAASTAQKALSAGAAAAVTGASLGLAQSREDEETSGAAIGAILGLGLAGATEGAIRGIKHLFKKAEPEVKEVLENTQRKFARDAEEKIQPVVERRIAEEAPINSAKEYIQATPEGQQSLLRFNEFASDADSAILREVTEIPLMSRAAEREMLAEMQELGIKETDEASRKAYIAFKQQQEELKEFAQYISGRDVKPQLEDALQILEHRAATEGREKVARLSKDFQSIKTAEKVLREEAERGLVREPIMSNFFSRVTNFIFDGSTFVARRIDRNLGTKFEPLLDRAAAAQNRFSLLSAQKHATAEAIEKFIENNKVDREVVYDILNGTRSINTVDGVTAQAASQLRKAFDESLEEARKLGLPIGKLQNYVPQAMVDIPTALTKMDEMARLIKTETGTDVLKGLDKAEYQALIKSPSNNVQQYVKALSNLTGEPTNNVFQFNKAVKLLSQPAEIGRKWGTVATAALKREGEIPAFLREKDVVYLFRKWKHNTFRHAFFRDIIDEGKRLQNLATKVNDKDTASYLSNWVETMSGGKPSWSPAKALADARIRFEVGIKRAINNPETPAYKKVALSFIAETPEVFSMMMRSIHSNVLGLSIKAVIPNLVQPIVMGIPELGLRYGSLKVAKAYSKVAAKILSGEWTKAVERLQMEGLLGGKWTGDAVKALDEGLQSAKIIRKADKGFDKLRAFSMYMYEKTEVLNTLVAKELADEISKDLVKSLEGGGNTVSKQALKFVESMGMGYRRAMDDAISRGDEKQINSLISDYTKSKLVFNYTRSSLSEFGRVVGPLFSIFLKWPTSVAGDIAARYMEQGPGKGTITLTRKYLAPAAALYGIDALLLPGQEESDLQKVIIGQGVSRMAAIGNVQSILKGDILQPPAITMAAGAVKSLYGYTKGIEEGNEQVLKAAGNIFQLGMPGASLIRFLTQDLPGLTGKGLPREGSFLEKTEEGISNLTR